MKQPFTIEVTETLCRHITVEAESADEAVVVVEQRYKNEDIVLDWSDFVDVEFHTIYE